MAVISTDKNPEALTLTLVAEFNASHIGYKNQRIVKWSDVSRGAAHEKAGGDERAQALGINPLHSGSKLEDEGIVLPQHTRWAELMAPALEKA